MTIESSIESITDQMSSSMNMHDGHVHDAIIRTKPDDETRKNLPSTDLLTKEWFSVVEREAPSGYREDVSLCSEDLEQVIEELKKTESNGIELLNELSSEFHNDKSLFLLNEDDRAYDDQV